MDALCLRERNLLNLFVADISLCQAKGENKEHAFIKVRKHLFIELDIHCSTFKSNCFTFAHQSYEVAEDLGRAFSDRAIFQTFVEAESTLADGSVKVNIS